MSQIVKHFGEAKKCRKMPCNPSAVNISNDLKVFYGFHVLHCLWKERRVLNPPLHVATVTRLERRGVAVLLCRALRLSCKSISYSNLLFGAILAKKINIFSSWIHIIIQLRANMFFIELVFNFGPSADHMEGDNMWMSSLND